jgi:hypothetical protein
MLDLPVLAQTLLLLASANNPACPVMDTPVIHINPTTAEIEYDFTQTEETLTKVKTGSPSPYGLGVDTITRGLRHDKPQMNYTISYGTAQERRTNNICMWYKEINVDIQLRPKIYIAENNARGDCGKFILKHERKHVAADRIVMNEYSQKMGIRIQEAVNKMGAVGPFDGKNMESIKRQMTQRIKGIIEEETEIMKLRMKERQATIDTLEEYEEGDVICSRHARD